MSGTAGPSTRDDGAHGPQPSSSEEIRDLTIRLLRMSASLVGELADAHGLASGDVTALRALDLLSSGADSVGGLRRQLGLSSAAATGLVDRLERAGLAVREPHPADRRRVRVVLTAAAREFGATRLRPLARRIDDAVTGLDDDQAHAVLTYLRSLTAPDRPDPAP